MKYQDDEYYHVFNRGTNKGTIFFSEENYRYCLRLMAKYDATYGVAITAYCLMPNHYHLILRQNKGGSTSRFLQTTFNAYTQALNTERHRSGTLFEGRAKSIRVDKDSYLLQLVQYIHLNPVVAGLVALPEQWQHSDYREWIDNDKSVEARGFYFKHASDYKIFVDEYQHEKEKEEIAEYLFD